MMGAGPKLVQRGPAPHAEPGLSNTGYRDDISRDQGLLPLAHVPCLSPVRPLVNA
jgi:hypothetical protein